MILTTCAACAAPLALDAPRCVRCKVRYCDSTCQHDHYVGRPETDWARRLAMSVLGSGLHDARNYEDALSVQEAELSTERRLGASKSSILFAQANIAITYECLGRLEQALQMKRDVYSETLKLYGKEHEETLQAANNYAAGFLALQRYQEAKSRLRRTMPMARRVLGDSNDLTLRMRKVYAEALYQDPGATLDDLREAVNMLEELERTARRVLGGAHPTTNIIEVSLQQARAVLRARETPSPGNS